MKVICLGGNNITPKNGGPVEAIRDTFDHVKSLTNTVLEKTRKFVFSVLTRDGYRQLIQFTGSIAVLFYRSTCCTTQLEIQQLKSGKHMKTYEPIVDLINFFLQQTTPGHFPSICHSTFSYLPKLIKIRKTSTVSILCFLGSTDVGLDRPSLLELLVENSIIFLFVLRCYVSGCPSVSFCVNRGDTRCEPL